MNLGLSEHLRRRCEAAIIAVLAFASVTVWVATVARQPLAIDFGPLWVGARTALSTPELLYDFSYITRAQAWLAGPDLELGLRPFVYPPSALLVLAPFGLLPFWWAYALWTALSTAFFIWASLKAGAPWWTPLLPAVALVACVGQVTTLVGGLILLGLVHRDRQVLSGVLFGLAAAIKPQLLLFLPLALAADRRWAALLVAGLAGATTCAIAALAFGSDLWPRWFDALRPFGALIVGHDGLLKRAATPYAALVRFGVSGAWAYLLVPILAVVVWLAFRRLRSIPLRLIALTCGALAVSPYAMNYELAVAAPAVAMLARRASATTWPGYLALVFFYGLAFTAGPLMLAALLTPVVIALVREAREKPVPEAKETGLASTS